MNCSGKSNEEWSALVASQQLHTVSGRARESAIKVGPWRAREGRLRCHHAQGGRGAGKIREKGLGLREREHLSGTEGEVQALLFFVTSLCSFCSRLSSDPQQPPIPHEQ